MERKQNIREKRIHQASMVMAELFNLIDFYPVKEANVRKRSAIKLSISLIEEFRK